MLLTTLLRFLLTPRKQSLSAGTRTAALGAIFALLLACGQAPRDPRNLLLITVDTLRPDHLGFGGSERLLSPNIDRLAASGVQFETSYSQAGWTLPSIASIMTGRYPSEHGATDMNRSLQSSLPTLATTLQGHGYDTRAYVSHVSLRPQNGLAEGFAHYDHSVLEIGHPHTVATAEPLTNRVLAHLPELSEPFFVWVHYFDPHFSYLSHPEWAHFGQRRIDRYDGEIAHTDFHLGRLLAALRTQGLDERTTIAFTADHGEEFGEHSGRFHYTLHEEVIQTPLVIRAPSLPAGLRSRPATQIDLLPTLLPLLGIEAPEDLPGVDLFHGPAEERAFFLERDRPLGVRQRGVILGHKKLLRIQVADADVERLDRRKGARLAKGSFLFDLEKDPEEQTNLAEEDPALTEVLQSLLDSHLAGVTDRGHAIELDAATKEKLQALGYLQ